MRAVFLDGNSLINRAYYGLAMKSRLTARDGTPTGAVMAFANMFLQFQEAYPAELWAVAFDLPTPTFRHQFYADYKAGRHSMPEDLVKQFPLIKRFLSLMGIRQISCEGYEADDLLGTLASWAEREGHTCTLISGDRDSYQLISEQVSVLMPKIQAGKTLYVQMTPTEIKESLGLRVDQLIDLKALMGDASDHIPGAKGVGEKTAVGLLQQYDNLQEIYAHLDELKPALAQKLQDSKEIVELSLRLATIKRDVPLELSEAAFAGQSRQDAELALFLDELQLKQLQKRLGLDVIEEKIQVPETEPWRFKQCREVKDLSKLWQASSRLCLLIEGALLALYAEDGAFWQGPIDDFLSFNRVSEVGGSPELVLEDYKALLHELGCPKLAGRILDLSLLAYLLSREESSSEPYRPEKIWAQFFAEEAPPCSGLKQQAECNLYLAASAQERMQGSELEGLYQKLELPLIPILKDMEQRGILIDQKRLAQVSVEMETQILHLEQKIFELAGTDFNIQSPLQLSQVLYEKLALPHGKKLKSGAYSTAAEALQRLQSRHPIVAEVLRYRELSKLRSTFVEGLRKEIARDGRIHSTFNQTRTATGRLSSLNPNLQNIPAKSDYAAAIRSFFIAAPGCCFLDADYSQLELRLLAHLSGDQALQEAFIAGADVHRETAARLFDLSPEAVGMRERRIAKTVNFSIVYGISAFGLASDLDISPREAELYIKAYHAHYPQVMPYLEGQAEKARSQGYVETLWGRRRYIPEIQSKNFNLRQFGARAAMNAPIQGTAADLVKKAMITLTEELEKRALQARILLQIHDELLLEVPESEAEEVAELLLAAMEGALPLAVPLKADLHRGYSWAEVKD